MNIIQQTWAELEQEVTEPGTKILIRTEVMPEKIGSLFLPPKQTEFYGRLKGSEVTLTATVLAVGKQCTEGLKPGDTILFKRIVFAPYKKMLDTTMLGWVNEDDIDIVTLPE